ncbi:MAG: cobalamin-independent methionine synthase II family protein [Gammaproteobacteria bacterium]
MALLTTTIGSYPKPDFVKVRDWVHPKSEYKPTYDAYAADKRYFQDKEISTSIFLGTIDAVRAQVEIGIDVPTDGEQGREHYIFYQLRHLKGVDFNRLQSRALRNVEEWCKDVPTISGKIEPQDPFLRYDWQIAQKIANHNNPVKITLPGPMTIADTVVDEYYGDEPKLNKALAEALNAEIRDLVDAGCKWIQVDEPLFARFPGKALDYGIENLERCFFSVPYEVNRVVHLCCGYPRELDDPDPLKADQNSYFKLAGALDEATVDTVSIEDAHRHNDLTLLERFRNTRIILGVVAIAKTRIEAVDEIRDRLTTALHHIDPERLIVGPDCGLGMLDKDTAHEKLGNLVEAARTTQT